MIEVMCAYRCYLGKHKGVRLQWIMMFLKLHKGRNFFKQYSTAKDSIADFIKRCDDTERDLLPGGP